MDLGNAQAGDAPVGGGPGQGTGGVPHGLAPRIWRRLP
jgi:hypothetical protein